MQMTAVLFVLNQLLFRSPITDRVLRGKRSPPFSFTLFAGVKSIDQVTYVRASKITHVLTKRKEGGHF